MKKPSAQSGGLFIVRINTAHNNLRAYTRGFYINPAHPIRLTPYSAPLIKLRHLLNTVARVHTKKPAPERPALFIKKTQKVFRVYGSKFFRSRCAKPHRTYFYKPLRHWGLYKGLLVFGYRAFAPHKNFFYHYTPRRSG